MNKLEYDEYQKLLQKISKEIDIINYENFNNIEYTQKLCALNTIIELLKLNCDIRMIPLEDNKITFILNVK